MDWLRAQGVDPHEVRDVTIRLHLTTVHYGHDGQGRRVLDEGVGEPCTYVREGIIDSMPPLHPSRRRWLGWWWRRKGSR